VNKKILLYLLALGAVAIYLVLVGWNRWGDDRRPQVTLSTPFTLVGPSTPLAIHIEDNETGLQYVSIRIVQNLETYPLVDQQFPSHGALSLTGGTEHTFDFNVVPYADNTLPRRHGPATLVISARDYSWSGFFEGNWTKMEQEFSVKFDPPTMEVLSLPLPITLGGSGVIFYRVSNDATRYGVQIGESFFPGYPSPDETYNSFSLIAFPHDLPLSTPIQLVTDDGLGNVGTKSIDITIQPKKWRSREIRITDRFIERTVMPIIAQTPDLEDLQDPLQNFLQVNHTLRKKNADQLKALAATSHPGFLWKGGFLQLSNSQVEAAFADHRKYLYQGKVVDTQYHLGFDLAVTKQYPVEAANDGIVVLSEFFGIYGNTIVIDHGYGLQSLYAHLSSLEAKKGDQVLKGQMIGRSGMTGLAAGDHLHFSLLLQGVQINPIEWWDSQWVRSRISDRLRKYDPIEPETALSQTVIPVKPLDPANPFGPRTPVNPRPQFPPPPPGR